jgi:hypothetical protein
MTNGFCEELIDDISIHTFSDCDEASIDDWVQAFVRTIDETPVSEPFRVLMDVSAPQVNFSRYARQKSQEYFSLYRGRKGRLAFLFSSRTAPHYARIFFASLGKLQFKLQFFRDRERALDWLRGD